MEILSKLLDKPPYFIFVFIGAVFVIISLITQHYFTESWAFFLYSVAGTFWRHIDKDMETPLKDLEIKNLKLWIRSIYHIGNIGLFLALLFYLDYL